MANKIPVPDDLQHLIEKREQSTRRDGTDRRSNQQATTSGTEPPINGDEADQSQANTDGDSPTAERRSGQDRRQQARRSSDKE